MFIKDIIIISKISMLRFRTPPKQKLSESSSSILKMTSLKDSSKGRSINYTPFDHYHRSEVNKILALCHPDEDQQTEVYIMVPYYIRLKIKDINQISYRESTAIMNASLVINIDVTGLPPEILKKIKSRLTLQINHCQQVKIKESHGIEIAEPKEFILDNKQTKKEMRQLRITIRKEFQVSVEKSYSYIFCSPYEELVVIATFTLNNIVWEGDKKKFKVSFNSMSLSMDDLISDYQKKGKSQHTEKLKAFLKEIQYEENNIKDISKQFKSCDSIVNNRTEAFKKLFLRDEHRLSLQLYLKEIRLEFDKATSGDYHFSTRRFGVEDTNKKYHNSHKYTCLGQHEKAKKQKEIKDSKKQEDKQQNNQEEDDMKEVIKKFRKEGYKQGQKFPPRYKPFKEYHQYTHFCVTLYKSPFPQILTILLPNLFLGIISFYIFYFKHNLMQRTNIIATLLLGFIQLIPTIKAQLSDSTKVTLLECLTCISTLLCFASFYDSFTREEGTTIDEGISTDEGKTNSQRFSFDDLCGNNFWFTISFIVNICLLLTVVLSLVYYFYYQHTKLLHPSYYKPRKSKLFSWVRSFIHKIRSKFVNTTKSSKSYSSDYMGFRQYGDYVILKEFFKIPCLYEQRLSRFWSNKKLQEQLEQKFQKKKQKFYEFEGSELWNQLLKN